MAGKIVKSIWRWYIQGFRSSPGTPLYASPRFYRVLLTLFAVGLISQPFQSEPTVTSPLQGEPTVTSPPASPSVKSDFLSGEYEQQYIEQGRHIVEGLDGIVQTSGEMTATTAVRSIIPRSGWENLSIEEQIAVTYFTQSIIAQARANPHSFITIATDAPIYQTFVSRISNICDECWLIIVSDTDTQPYGIDQVAVAGDPVWLAKDPCCRGEKGSKLRAKLESP